MGLRFRACLGSKIRAFVLDQDRLPFKALCLSGFIAWGKDLSNAKPGGVYLLSTKRATGKQCFGQWLLEE